MEILKKETIEEIIESEGVEIAKAIVADAKDRVASGSTIAEINLETGKWYVYWEESNTYTIGDDAPTYTIYRNNTPETDVYCDEKVLWDDVFPIIDRYMEEHNVDYDEARDKILEMEGTSYQEQLEITMDHYADMIYDEITNFYELDICYQQLENQAEIECEEMEYI